MLKNISQKLEDPNRPLLGPNFKCLEFWGLLIAKKGTLRRKIHIFIHIIMFLFMFTEFIDIWYIRSDQYLLLSNIKSTMLAIVSVFKVVSIFYWQKHWRDIIEYVTASDIAARNSEYKGIHKIINYYTKYSRRITYLYWILTFITAVAVISLPISYWISSSSYRYNVRNGIENYYQVVNSWVPFDKNTLSGYLLASAYQSFATLYCGGWISSYDTNAIVIMVFFKYELAMIKLNCTKIFAVDDEEEVLNRIKQCHKRHTNLVKYANLYNSCLSPVMLLYMVACSAMLCASLYQTTSQSTLTQKLITTPYLLLGVSQLFMYSWHGNEVLFESHDLIRGVYQSRWYKKALYRRELILLVGQLDRPVKFSAGPFFDLTIAVFVQILKGAYSYYMLIIKKKSN